MHVYVLRVHMRRLIISDPDKLETGALVFLLELRRLERWYLCCFPSLQFFLFHLRFQER